MKRFLIYATTVLLLLMLSACGLESRQDRVLSSLGRWERRNFYTSGGFQDFTDFAIYAYPEADLTESPYFAPLGEGDRERLSGFLDNFEGWIESIGHSDPQNEVVVHYAFDRRLMDTRDWFYIYEDPDYPEFGCYDLWFFDSQTHVLYYFHSNI